MTAQLLLETPPQFDSLEAVQQAAAQCTQCSLHTGRTHSVFFDGNPKAKLMVVGEGPGQNEDETGIPFVGRAGQLLTKMLESVQIDRQNDVYICNIVKCRPPQNRKPLPAEMAACMPFLQAQINLIQPRYVLMAGATAMEGLLGIKQPISKARGQWVTLPNSDIQAMPIFHPSYLLRNASREPGSPKWHTWQDLLDVKAKLDALN